MVRHLENAPILHILQINLNIFDPYHHTYGLIPIFFRNYAHLATGSLDFCLPHSLLDIGGQLSVVPLFI